MALRATTQEGGRLVVLTHRLPDEPGPEGQAGTAPGGLLRTLRPLVEERGALWFGWPGPSATPPVPRPDAEGAATLGIELPEGLAQGWRHDFSEASLWPLFHSMPCRARFSREGWEAYDAVNARFADAALEHTSPDDVLWIHDYPLLRVAHHLRRARPRQRIALFVHVPFPPREIFEILPWSEALLRGIASCDLVGFQVARDARNLLDCATALPDVDVCREWRRIRDGWRTTRVGSFPIGADWAGFESAAREAPERPHGSERIVLAADRLDPTKGIPERLRAFETLLETHPEHVGRVTLLQLTVPDDGRDCAMRLALKREIDQQVGRINGRFASERWMPVRYLCHAMETRALAALYRDADVALVTPLRDGMNLVAKEFVASRVREPGVLVLSRTAGAAEQMPEALLVNPHDTDAVAEALHRALAMPEDEREKRMTALRATTRWSDVHAWADTFLREANLGDVPTFPEQTGRSSHGECPRSSGKVGTSP